MSTNSDAKVEKLRSICESSSKGLDSMQRSLATIDEKLGAAKTSRTTGSLVKLETPRHLILYPKNERFFGREDILSVMSHHLLPPAGDGDGIRSFALHGIAGVGKTQIALKFVHDHINRYKAVFWVSADSIEKLSQGYVDIARKLGLNNGSLSEDQSRSIQSVKEWFLYARKFPLFFKCTSM
jgi:hypothetical protein